MNNTPFPTKPVDVVTLTAQEFMLDFDMNNIPSIDVVCGRFADDANRALVWLIRFGALRAWRGRADVVEWLNSSSATLQDICEVAAALELNDDWEFDTQHFRSAIDDRVISRRTKPHGR